MVLFSNINLNQRVEVLRAGLIFTGTVKFKGCLNREPGEWVGVALDTPGKMHQLTLNIINNFVKLWNDFYCLCSTKTLISV